METLIVMIFPSTFKHLILHPVQNEEDPEQRRRIRVVIIMSAYHLLLSCPLLLLYLMDHKIVPSVVIQFLLSTVVLSLIYFRQAEIGIRVLITTLVVSNLLSAAFSDLASMLYIVPAFAAVSVLLHQKFRVLYAVIVILLVAGTGILTAHSPVYAGVDQGNIVLFTILATLSVLISTSITEGDLTQFRLQMSQIRESERLYRLLAEHTNDIVTLHDVEGAFLYASPSLMRNTGYTWEELRGFSCNGMLTLIHPDDQKLMSDAYHILVLQAKSVSGLELRLRRKNGEYRWYEVSAEPVKDKHGAVIQIALSAHDITERKNIEQALRDSETKLKTAERIARVGYMDVDWSQQKLILSETLCEQIHVQPGTPVDLSYLFSFLTPEDAEKQAKQVHQYIAEQRESYVIESHLQFPDGVEQYVMNETRVTYGDDGQPAHMFSVVQDITEHRLLELELRQKHHEFEQFFKAALDFLCIADSEGRMIKLNQVWENTLGYSLCELQGKPYYEFVHPDDLSAMAAEQYYVTEEGTIRAFSNRIQCKNGQYRTLEWRVTRMDGQFYATARDITERVQVEEALRRSEEQLAEAQQLAHIGSWRWDVKSDRVIWSAEMYRIFGLSPEAFRPDYKQYLDALHPQDREDVDAIIQNAYRTHQPYSLYHRLIHPEKGERIIHGLGKV